MANKKKELNFEEAIKELEQTVKGMESGDLGLDELLSDFEKGIGLLRLCEKKLAEAEGRIEVLTKAETVTAPTLRDVAEEDSSLPEAPPYDEPKLPF
jgi:exodeoxyribonuclease VII small subunit